MNKKLLQKGHAIRQAGFTLVELLIVIALISILSVAVLATINPIEQANKAKDSTVQNDAAEVMNAYERYYANAQMYPWMKFQDAITVDDGVLYRSDQAGFGMCYADTDTASSVDEVSDCPTTGDFLGLLVEADELKASFAGKSEFQDVVSNASSRHEENALWLYKDPGSGGSIYVCYIPKAKSNRQQTDKLYCLGDDGAGGYTRVAADDSTSDDCEPVDVSGTDAAAWSRPDLSDTEGKFMCVPE